MNWLLRLLLAALALYLLIAAIAFFAQRKMIYFPPDIYHSPPDWMAEVRTGDLGHGWYAPAQDGKPTVMVFHGNASSIDSNMHIFRDLHAAGYGVWSVGYPGYPPRSDRITQTAIVKSALEQYDFLKKPNSVLDIDIKNIILYGTSLGSGVATQVAAQREVELLILDAPFHSMSDMARRQTPWLPTGLLLKDRWRSGRAVATQDAPLIWIHGTADRVVPLAQGQKLFDSYTGPKSAHVIDGAHHTNTWLLGGREIVLERLSKL